MCKTEEKSMRYAVKGLAVMECVYITTHGEQKPHDVSSSKQPVGGLR